MTSSFPDRLQKIFEESLIFEGKTPTHFLPLVEEASSRKYYRVFYPEFTAILYYEPTINPDYLNIGSFLLQNGFSVPKSLKQIDSSFMLISDEGSKDLSDFTEDAFFTALESALELILKFSKLVPPKTVSERKFDFEKFQFESNHTLKGLELFSSQFSKTLPFRPIQINGFLENTNFTLASSLPMQFTHRDFHSRNLLVQDSKITILDFQDARLGLVQYDLSSILYDAYKPIPLEKRQSFLKTFFKEYENLHGKQSEKKFLQIYYLQAFQRSNKALGTYLHMVSSGKTKFGDSIEPCLQNILEILQLGLFPDIVYLYYKDLLDVLV